MKDGTGLHTAQVEGIIYIDHSGGASLELVALATLHLSPTLPHLW